MDQDFFKKCFDRLVNIVDGDIISYLKYALLPFILAIIARYLILKFFIRSPFDKQKSAFGEEVREA